LAAMVRAAVARAGFMRRTPPSVRAFAPAGGPSRRPSPTAAGPALAPTSSPTNTTRPEPKICNLKPVTPETFNPNRPMKTQCNHAALAPSGSADFQSAVARISNPQTTHKHERHGDLNARPARSRRLARSRPLARPSGPCSRCARSIPCAASQAAQGIAGANRRQGPQDRASGKRFCIRGA